MMERRLAGEDITMQAKEKQAVYNQALLELEAILEGIREPIAVMATISCHLKAMLPYYYWSGFYRLVEGALLIGPYQGTLGCLHIDIGRGVCGAAAERSETVIVDDVHEFPGHIACDAASSSEIVVPVFGPDGLIAVFDVDATEKGAFDEVDRLGLEAIMRRFFTADD